MVSGEYSAVSSCSITRVYVKDMEFAIIEDENAIIEQTCQVLSEVFGFSYERAREAVDAIPDKRDVEVSYFPSSA